MIWMIRFWLIFYGHYYYTPPPMKDPWSLYVGTYKKSGQVKVWVLNIKKTSIKIPMNLKNLIQYCIKGHTYKDEQQNLFHFLKGRYILFAIWFDSLLISISKGPKWNRAFNVLNRVQMRCDSISAVSYPPSPTNTEGPPTDRRYHSTRMCAIYLDDYCHSAFFP